MCLFYKICVTIAVTEFIMERQDLIMGFIYINDEQKIRISLSKKALSVIYEDMEIFGEKKMTSFINKVMTNFHNSSIASVSEYLSKKKEELFSIFEHSAIKDKEKEIVIGRLLEEEKRKALDIINSFLSERGESKIYHINNSNIEFLEEDCKDADFYNQRPGQYIKCIMEEYSRLPFIERERIYRKEVFEIIENACKNHSLLKIKTYIDNKPQKVIVYPYKIMPDSQNTQLYLACFTRFEDEAVKEKKDASFSMARIPKPTVLNQTAFLSKNDIEIIEKDIESLSVAYLLGENKEIRVRLTEQGKRIYSIKLFSRPSKDIYLSTNNEYVFHCTENQAFFYFYTFGAEAEIISPISLRNRFIQFAEKMLDVYK